MIVLRTAEQRRKSNPVPVDRPETDAGFTLIELLVVLGILVMLATLVAPQVLRYLGGARSDAAKTQINSLLSATELYYLDVGAYPPSDQGLNALIVAPPQAKRWNGPYLKKGGLAPLDPWGKPYVYQFPGKHGSVDIFSLGRDGQPGGSGEDADVASW
jgi:general secretion pathway protein G